MDHERHEPELGHGIDDGLVRIQVRIPPRGYGLLTGGVQMPDPVLRKVEHDRFERWFVHARTLPTCIGANPKVASGAMAGALAQGRRRGDAIRILDVQNQLGGIISPGIDQSVLAATFRWRIV
jgi:hypothetical protein